MYGVPKREMPRVYTDIYSKRAEIPQMLGVEE
jgi:hypothetical protein